MDILRGLPSAFVQCVLQEFPSIWAQLHFYEQELRGAGTCLLGRMELLRSLRGYLRGACWRTSSLSTGLFKWELYCLFFLSSRIPRQKWSSYFCPQTSWSAVAWLAGFTAPYYFRVLLRFNFFLFWLLFVSSTVLVLWSCSRALQLHSVLLYGVHHTEPEGLHAYGCTILNLPLPSSEALSGGGHSWVGAVLWAGCELVLKWVVLWPSELPSRQIRVLQVVSVSDVSFPWGQWLSTCCWACCAGSDACFDLNFVPGSYLALWLHRKSGGSCEKGECEKWGRCPALCSSAVCYGLSLAEHAG